MHVSVLTHAETPVPGFHPRQNSISACHGVQGGVNSKHVLRSRSVIVAWCQVRQQQRTRSWQGDSPDPLKPLTLRGVCVSEPRSGQQTDRVSLSLPLLSTHVVKHLPMPPTGVMAFAPALPGRGGVKCKIIPATALPPRSYHSAVNRPPMASPWLAPCSKLQPAHETTTAGPTAAMRPVHKHRRPSSPPASFTSHGTWSHRHVPFSAPHAGCGCPMCGTKPCIIAPG